MSCHVMQISQNTIIYILSSQYLLTMIFESQNIRNPNILVNFIIIYNVVTLRTIRKTRFLVRIGQYSELFQ